MFRKLMRNKKAQQTAEYALLISLVVAAVIAMQTYAQRTIQARIRDAGQYMARETSALGSTNQYEPYYLSTDYNIERDDSRTEVLGVKSDGGGLYGMNLDQTRLRKKGGFQESSYSAAGLINGL